jgi:hypothetical protein
MAKLTRAQAGRAWEQWVEWRTSGVPDTVTYHEAYQLTGGLVGDPERGRGTPLSLATVAGRYAKKNKEVAK